MTPVSIPSRALSFDSTIVAEPRLCGTLSRLVVGMNLDKIFPTLKCSVSHLITGEQAASCTVVHNRTSVSMQVYIFKSSVLAEVSSPDVERHHDVVTDEN